MLRLKDIEHNFSSNVARVVDGLSDSLTEDSDKKQSWQKRKETYIERLRREPRDVQLISAADKLYNARTILEDYREIGPRIWERFKRGRQEQIRNFDELLKVYKSSGTGRLAEELERVVAELRQISGPESAVVSESYGKNSQDDAVLDDKEKDKTGEISLLQDILAVAKEEVGASVSLSELPGSG